MKTRSDDYWAKRSLERLSEAEKTSITYLKQVQKEYRATARAIVEQVRKLYATYYGKSGFDIDALNKVASQGDVKRFLVSMEAQGLPTDLPNNCRGRMSRLELLNSQMLGKVKQMATKESVATTDLYDKVFRNTYYRTGYDVSKGLGETLAFGSLDDKTVDKVLESKFYGKNYSERIWGNSNKLADQLQSIISQAIATGQSSEKTVRLVRERFNVSQSNAARLVRTETCYFENQAEIEAYKEMGISEYVILATLDSRTSKICREMDGKRFKIKNAVAGETLPPLHPYCRTAIRPYIGIAFEPKTRIMRDPETGKNKTIEQMTYHEWRAQYIPNEPKANQKGLKVGVIGGLLNQRWNKWQVGDDLFVGANRPLIEKSIKQASRILEEYPIVSESIRENGGIAFELVDAATYKAATSTDNSRILFSRKAFANREKYLAVLEKEMKVGFKMRVPKMYHDIYTITHEMGHVVENYLVDGKKITRAEYNKRATAIKNDIIKIAQQMSNKTRSEVLAEMSDYGRKKPQEFFAEAFVAHKLGSPNIWGKAMREYLRERGLK